MKNLSIALSLFALLGVASAAQAANEVKLQEYNATVTSYHWSSYNTHIEALVSNLSPTKVVNLHAQLANGTWTDIPLSYNRPANNNLEVWTLDLFDNYSSRFGSSNATFALSYTVNGQTYWDNNGGANYSLPLNAGSILFNGTNVYNQPIQSIYYLGPDNIYSGSVTLRNIAPAKNVKVVYTTDGWKTSATVNGSFTANYWTNAYISLSNPTPYGFEEWTYSLPVSTTATQIEYAISYTVNGQTYWDNNFGQNYKATLSHYNR